MLHVQFFPRDGNAIILETALPLRGKTVARVSNRGLSN